MKKPKEGNCQRCGCYRWSLDRDHIVPRAKGGTDDPSNIQYLCQNCHHDKTWLEDRIRPWLGKKHTDASRAKISQSKKANPSTARAIEASAAARRGVSLSEEHKAAISRSGKGQKRSETTRLRIRISKLTAKRNRGRFA